MGEPGEQPKAVEASSLGFSIDRTADVPIGIQLVWALRTRIGAGELAPGQRLPGLRDLADSTGVNVNTARAVYQRLEQDGLIESQHGSGTFVAYSQSESAGATTIAAGAARRAREAGVDPRDVAAALYVSTSPARVATQVAAGQRALLRAQITALERALGQIEAEHPGLAPRSSTTGPASGPTLLSSEALEQTRAHLVHRLARMQAAIDEATSEAANTDVHEERVATAVKGKASTRANRSKPKARPAPAGA
jgi:DNA-binding transcriptional regulator YhcF (GntR family)